MARAIWSGVISFGLVSIPVELYSATEAHEPTFHQFEKGTTDRIRYQRVNERTGDEVEYSDIVKGADIGGGNYVMLDQDELDSVAPGRSRLLEIHTFVDLDDVDPIYFNKTYFLGPGNDEASKPYALLRDAMADANKAAIATLVMRGKEYLAAIRADGDLLALETLFFADEIRDPHDQVDDLPGQVKLSQQERRMASQLIGSLSGPWKPSDYRDTYTDRVNDLIEAKKHDRDFKPADEPPAATNVLDLGQALRASLDAVKKPSARRSTADKSTARKAAGTTKPGRATTKAAKGTQAQKTRGRKNPAKETAAKKPARRRRGVA